MFTGIIQEIGKVTNLHQRGGGISFAVAAPRSSKELKVNDSVAINGVCQTVVAKEGTSFSVVAVEETLAKTTLRELRAQASVNIELPLQLGDRLGGHLVSGHVDTVGVIESIERRETSWFFGISIPSQFRRYVIPVGSIAVDGVSLTIASVEGSMVGVSIIPHTMENTIFTSYSPKSKVNLEFDMIGKYIEQMVITSNPTGSDSISRDQLRAWGYDV